MVLKFAYSDLSSLPEEVPKCLIDKALNIPNQMNTFLSNLLQIPKTAPCALLPYSVIQPIVLPHDFTRPGGHDILTKITDLRVKEQNQKVKETMLNRNSIIDRCLMAEEDCHMDAQTHDQNHLLWQHNHDSTAIGNNNQLQQQQSDQAVAVNNGRVKSNDLEDADYNNRSLMAPTDETSVSKRRDRSAGPFRVLDVRLSKCIAPSSGDGDVVINGDETALSLGPGSQGTKRGGGEMGTVVTGETNELKRLLSQGKGEMLRVLDVRREK